jgi:hypothetical protein
MLVLACFLPGLVLLYVATIIWKLVAAHLYAT